MDRRIAIRNLALVLGGAALFPEKLLAGVKVPLQLHNLSISARHEKLLAGIADTIIPTTSTPGARDLKLHLFVLLMVNDCYGTTDQQAFAQGLSQFEVQAAKMDAKAFSLWPSVQREAFLLSIEHKNEYPEQLNTFYRIVKDKVIEGYTQSQYFMTKQVVYELVPGRYTVDVLVKKQNKATGKRNG